MASSINLAAPRLSPTEALTAPANPATDPTSAPVANPTAILAASAQAPLSTNQKTRTALALACELEITPPNYHAALISNHQMLVEQKDAADYIQRAKDKIVSRRKTPPDE